MPPFQKSNQNREMCGENRNGAHSSKWSVQSSAIPVNLKLLSLEVKILKIIILWTLEWLNDRPIDPTSLEKLESWKKNEIGNAIFEVEGNYTRCGAVCIDPETAIRQKTFYKPLLNVAAKQHSEFISNFYRLKSILLQALILFTFSNIF